IEIIRNVPLLLRLFFYDFAVLNAMPAVRASFALPLGFFVNQRGIIVPRPMPDAEIIWVGVAAIIAIIGAIALVRWAISVRAQTGHYPSFVKMGSQIAGLVVTFLFGYLALALLGSVVPALGSISFLPLIGGAALAALSLTPMSVYSRAFIGFAIAWAIARFALGGMFGFLPELAVVGFSGLLALGYAWT